jgi:hypothetical protein
MGLASSEQRDAMAFHSAYDPAANKTLSVKEPFDEVGAELCRHMPASPKNIKRAEAEVEGFRKDLGPFVVAAETTRMANGVHARAGIRKPDNFCQ